MTGRARFWVRASLSEALPNSSVRPRISIVSAALASGATASSALRAAEVSIAAPDAKVIITVLGRGSTVGLLASAWTNVAAGITEGVVGRLGTSVPDTDLEGRAVAILNLRDRQTGKAGAVERLCNGFPGSID